MVLMSIVFSIWLIYMSNESANRMFELALQGEASLRANGSQVIGGDNEDGKVVVRVSADNAPSYYDNELRELLNDFSKNLNLSEILYPKALANPGDLSKLENFYLRLARGENMTILAIGGSITGRDYNHASQLVRLLQVRFRKANIKLIRIGMGGIGSFYFRYCLKNIMVDYRISAAPQFDLVIVDFTVNDWGNHRADPVHFPPAKVREHYEALIYAINNMGNPAFISIMFTQFFTRLPLSWKGEPNMEQQHLHVTRRLGIPTLSYSDAILHLYGPMGYNYSSKETVMHTDLVHPSVIGSELGGDLLMMLVESAGRQLRRRTEPLPPFQNFEPPPSGIELDSIPVCMTPKYCPEGYNLTVISSNDWLGFSTSKGGSTLHLRICVKEGGVFGMVSTKSWDPLRRTVVILRLDGCEENTRTINGTIIDLTIPMPDQDIFKKVVTAGCHDLEIKSVYDSSNRIQAFFFDVAKT